MNLDNYRRFLEAIGHRTIVSPSGYWFDISRSFYESIPPVRVITPDREELDTLFAQHQILGLKYCAPSNVDGKPSWIYMCRDRDYDINSVHRKMRNKVRQGLRNCTVRPISFEHLHAQGMRLNRDTLRRQRRRDPVFTDPARWRQLCKAGERIVGAAAWGAFVEGELAAYLIIFVVNGCCNILHQMSRADLLDAKANNALAFVATREMMASPDIQAVSYGHASVRRLPGLEEYKIRLGYERWPMRYVAVLHPLLRTVMLSSSSTALIGRLHRLFPEQDVLRRIVGIIDIAVASRKTEAGSGEETRRRRVSDGQASP